MSKLLAACLLVAGVAAARPALADGCYTCEGARTYVRYKGEDDWAKRHKAEACGCRITGTASKCGGPGEKVLCSVARAGAASPRELPARR